MKIIFFVPYPSEGASNRFRVQQYLPYLNDRGIKYSLRPFVSSAFFRVLYSPGMRPEKIGHFIASSVKRLGDLVSSLSYDIAFVHREIFPIGGPFFENLLHRSGVPIIFDFDDAIFIADTSEGNNFMERLKRPDKVAKIISMASHVIAANRYLADFALKHSPKVSIIPTPIDTDKYKPAARRGPADQVVIGWMGSHTTAKYLKGLENVFLKIKARYDFAQIRFVGGVCKFEKFSDFSFRPWSLEGEVEELQQFDIGIMPMPDNVWTRGKCGFKAIQYMAVGAAAVCSPVGVNTDIVADGENGLLAQDEAEWVGKLSMLIEDRALRMKMGMKGRDTAEKRYSLKAHAPAFLDVIESSCRRSGPSKESIPGLAGEGKSALEGRSQ